MSDFWLWMSAAGAAIVTLSAVLAWMMLSGWWLGVKNDGLHR